MLLDAQNLFSDRQAVTATANSTNVIDLDAGGQTRDLGDTYGMRFFAAINDDFVGGTSVKISLVGADTDDLATNPQTIMETPAIAVADLTSGAIFLDTMLPQGMRKAYLGVVYTVAGTPTAGTITAGIAISTPKNVAYQSGYTV